MEKNKKIRKSFYWKNAVKFTVYIVDRIEQDDDHQFDAYCQKRENGDIEIFYKKDASLTVLLHESLHAISFMCRVIGEEDITLADAFSGEVMTYEMSELQTKILKCFFALTGDANEVQS